MGCECLIFAIIIIASIISNVNKVKSDSLSNAGSDNVNLDDIFNDVMKASNQKLGSSKPLVTPSLPAAQPRRTSRPASRSANASQAQRQSLITPTTHDSHNCNDVNYDKLGSLEGGTGSFNLGNSEPVAARVQETKVKIGREDLLKSFIMSEVLQRYDINRIYSRIPSIKNDD